MKKTEVVAALAALAQDNRLDVFRLLVEAGPEGLVTVRRDGRSMIYAAQFETMNSLLGYLTDNCCGGAPCAPAVECQPTRKRTKIPA
jgi:ArsR family transcriptional regulator